MAKTKVVKAKVTKSEQDKQTKGALNPYEIWDVYKDGYFSPEASFRTKKEAEKDVREGSYRCPVIVHTDIPPMKY